MAMEASANALVCTFCWQRAAIGHSPYCSTCEDELETALCGTSDTQDSQESLSSCGSGGLFDAGHDVVNASTTQPDFARALLLDQRQWDLPTKCQFSHEMTVSSCSSSAEVERLAEILEELRLGTPRDQLHILKELSEPESFCSEDLLNAGVLLATLPFLFDHSNTTVHTELAWRVVLRLAECDPQSVSLEGSVFREGLIPMLVQLQTDPANALHRRRHAALLLARLVLDGVNGTDELLRNKSSEDMLDVLSWEHDSSIVSANVQVLRLASLDDPTLKLELDAKIHEIQSRLACRA